MKSLSKVSQKIDGQPMFKYLEKARELEKGGKHMIHFEIGEPDFNTPRNITNAALRSLQAGDTHYCSSYGLPEFREEIIKTTYRSRGFKPDLNQVLVTPGANISIFYAIACLVDPGCEVIVPDPGFSTYYSTIKMCGAKEVRVQLKESNEFKISPDDIEAAITDKTRLIIINSPHNPTGAVLSVSDMKKIYDIAVKHDIYLFSDEIYARMIYDNVSFCSPGSFDECKEHVIISNGFSKSFAMTGWRLGTVIGPSNVIERMAALLQTTSSCVSPFIQKAGIEAINGPQDDVKKMMRDYESRRDILVKGLNSVNGFTCTNPGGAFYVFPNITDTNLTSEEVVNLLMDNGVVTLPGSCFGIYGEHNIRLSYSRNEIELQEGLKRIKSVFGSKT